MDEPVFVLGISGQGRQLASLKKRESVRTKGSQRMQVGLRRSLPDVLNCSCLGH